MSWFDLVGFGIMGFNALRGIAAGLPKAATGAIAVLCASYLAWQHRGLGGALVDGWVPAELGFLARPAVMWAIGFGLVSAAGFGLRWTLKIAPPARWDRIIGGGMGVFSGMAMLTLPLLLVASFPLLQQIPFVQQELSASMLATALTPLVQWLLEWGP